MSLLVRDRDGTRVDLDEGDGGGPIDPRIEARRRDVADARRSRWRRRLLWLAIVVTVLGLLDLAVHSRLLDVDAVEVQGTRQTSTEAVLAAAAVPVGDPLVGIDLEGVTRRVEALPWVASAEVSRSWGGTVTVVVTERTAKVAVHTEADGWLTVDGERRVLATAPLPPEVPLPVVVGVRPATVGAQLEPGAAPAEYAVATALTPGLRSRVVVVDGTDPQALKLSTRPRGTVLLGSADDLDQKIASLQAVFAQVDLDGLCTVDIRVPDTPVLTRGGTCA